MKRIYKCTMRASKFVGSVSLTVIAAVALPAFGLATAERADNNQRAQSVTASPQVLCASLASLKLPDTSITFAREETDGWIKVAVPPDFREQVIRNLPPFCRVAGVIRPTTQSNILFEVWLPLNNWNGRFAGTGNGRLAGAIIYEPTPGGLTDSLAVQLRRGYAVGNTDTGHPAAVDRARFIYDYPEQFVDFGSRSVHEMTLKGKAITAAFYGTKAQHSYWYGCSTGGRQGLIEATRFPEDYDGVVAGSPTLDHPGSTASILDTDIKILNDPAHYLPEAKAVLLARAVMDACDSLDDLVDGLIEDPRVCHYDPAKLECAPGQDPNTCLTAEQVESANLMYAGLINPTTGEVRYFGRERGSEAQWTPFSVGPVDPVGTASWGKWVVFSDPNWDWTRFDFRRPADFDSYFTNDADLQAVLSPTTDLDAFRQRGGKVIQYHGWADNNPIPPRSSVSYYENVVSLFGNETQRFHRLFMAPGMSHCYSPADAGPNVFDMMTAIEDWVEKGTAPDRIIAAHKTEGVVDRTRPLCPYPSVARWTGVGSIDDEANFVCTEIK